MLQPRSIQSSLALKDKILSIDYILVVSILILGIMSMFAMYSTDGGEFKYHTNSHILRFFIFFGLLGLGLGKLLGQAVFGKNKSAALRHPTLIKYKKDGWRTSKPSA